MNRRGFLRMLGIGCCVAAAVPLVAKAAPKTRLITGGSMATKTIPKAYKFRELRPIPRYGFPDMFNDNECLCVIRNGEIEAQCMASEAKWRFRRDICVSLGELHEEKS